MIIGEPLAKPIMYKNNFHSECEGLCNSGHVIHIRPLVEKKMHTTI